jgi:hypothetical protein
MGSRIGWQKFDKLQSELKAFAQKRFLEYANEQREAKNKNQKK